MTFQIAADDGGRLLIDDAWVADTGRTLTLPLGAGVHKFVW